MLPALSLDSILHQEVVKNAVTSTAFCHFVKDLLLCMNKWLLPNSVLVVDNALIHKVAGIHKLVKGHSMCLMFLISILSS